MTKTRLLIVEDDPNLGQILKEYLEMKGYEADLQIDGEAGLKAYKQGEFDFCILDVMMPRKDGFTLAEEIRKEDAQIPLLFLTAKAMKEDTIQGLKIGADDYMTKPFSMEELLLRMEAILRRASRLQDVPITNLNERFVLGGLTFHPNRQILVDAGVEKTLTARESELLQLLCQNQNRTLSRSEALNALWGDDSYFNARSMDVYIAKLRKHLKDEEKVQILTVTGQGFRLVVVSWTGRYHLFISRCLPRQVTFFWLIWLCCKNFITMIQIIPSIWIREGRCVRVKQGDFSQEKIYEESPLDLARRFEDHGIKIIHLVDLDGARRGSPVNYYTLEAIAGHTSLKIDFAGGIQTDGDISKAFEYGAKYITAATVAVRNPELFASWIISYGRERMTLGADSIDGKIAIKGWQKQTPIDIFKHIEYFYNRGLKYVKTTDIARDGLLEGPSFELYGKMMEQFPDIQLLASGGVRSIEDIDRLNDMGVYSVIFGKALMEERIKLEDLKKYLT